MKTDYPFDKLFWQEFEDVVIDVCRDILGIAAQKFADGRDGGRDSVFSGIAEKFVSSSDRWSGDFIIQAKKTDNATASCSDTEFSGTGPNSILSKEIERLKKLMAISRFDNYILFTNRSLSAGVHDSIKTRLQKELGITNVHIVGKEGLSSYITPSIEKKHKLSRYIIPFRIYEKDIQSVIMLFHDNKDKILATETLESQKLKFVTLSEKNKLNNLSEEYFKIIKSNSLQHFDKIEKFLKDPINKKYALYYDNTVNDLQSRIITNRSEFAYFDNIFEYIYELLLDTENESLKDSRAMIRVFLHFMYCNCDIGVKE